MKILIVEDNCLLALMLEEELLRTGHTVLGPVASSAAAKELVRSDRCDCAFVDMDLIDGRTGGELAKWLSRRGGIPVVFATGQEELAEQYSDFAIGTLPKPINPNAFLVTVEAIASYKTGQSPNWPSALQLYL